ncbi:hypothetical protein Ccrd_012856, partial [Cynara cardunculus var. scolymus]
MEASRKETQRFRRDSFWRLSLKQLPLSGVLVYLLPAKCVRLQETSVHSWPSLHIENLSLENHHHSSVPQNLSYGLKRQPLEMSRSCPTSSALNRLQLAQESSRLQFHIVKKKDLFSWLPCLISLFLGADHGAFRSRGKFSSSIKERGSSHHPRRIMYPAMPHMRNTGRCKSSYRRPYAKAFNDVLVYTLVKC